MVQMTSTETLLTSEGTQKDGLPWETLFRGWSKLNYGSAENGISYFLLVCMERGTTFQHFSYSSAVSLNRLILINLSFFPTATVLHQLI